MIFSTEHTQDMYYSHVYSKHVILLIYKCDRINAYANIAKAVAMDIRCGFSLALCTEENCTQGRPRIFLQLV